MGLTGIFEIGRTALATTKLQLGVTGNNIANVNTPGYSRQEVIVEVQNPIITAQGFVGQGVSVAGIKRSYDGLLQNQIVQAQQDYGKFNTLNQSLSNIEQIFNESQNFGLASPLTEFFSTWQAVASTPEGLTERSLLLEKSNLLVNSAQSMELGINRSLDYIQDGITDKITLINSLASDIARLNGQIIQVEASQVTSSNELRDKREEALKKLSNLIELTSWEDPDTGSLTVAIGQKNIVSDTATKTLSTLTNETGRYNLKLDGQDITTLITKGEMGGLLTARQNIDDNLHDFRKLVAAIINTVNLQHGQGFGLDGTTNNDFFDPLQLTVKNYSGAATLTATVTDYSQLTLDEYTIRFNGGNYEIYETESGSMKTSGAYVAGGTTIDLEGIRFIISGAVTDQDYLTVSPLTSAVTNFATALTSTRKIAASGTAATLPGDNTNALAMAGLMDSQVTALGSTTLVNYYQILVGSVGAQSKAASNEMAYADNFLTVLNTRRDAISGVNMDEEASDLIRFQRAYEAAARLIKIADELLQVLLNL